MEWGTMFEFAVDCRNPVEHMGNLKKGISDILNHWGVEATQKVFFVVAQSLWGSKHSGSNHTLFRV